MGGGYYFAAILVYSGLFDSAGAFNTEHLGYITCICEDASDSRFHKWEIQSTRRLHSLSRNSVCDVYVISPEELITYEYLVKYSMCEYHDLFD